MASTTNVSNTNAKIFITVSLDAEVNVNEQLCAFVSDLKIFNSKNQCEKYIRSVSSQEQLLLIVSGRFGREFVPHIHHLRQIISIYVYCIDREANEQWTSHFTKIKAVTDRVDELISRIQTDQQHFVNLEKQQTTNDSVLPDETLRPFSKCDHLSLAYSYFLTNILLRMKPSKTAKIDLISFCKNVARKNTSQLKVLDEFQRTYTSDKAIWWYIRESFIFKILNTVLRMQIIDTIFLFQFFIHDLHQQITQCQCQSPIKVYRSQHKQADEINRLIESVGTLLIFNSFFSTTRDYDIALEFTKRCPADLYAVIFEIDADPEIVKTKPFGDITKYSYFPEEREVLFSINSIFRIKSVQQNSDRLWTIRMTLCSDTDPELQPIIDKIKRKYGSYEEESAVVAFSQILREMKKFDDAEKYCHRLLHEFSLDESLLGIVYLELAEIASNKRDYQLNNRCHEKAMKIKKKTESDSFFNSAGAANYSGDDESSDSYGTTDTKSIVTAVNNSNILTMNPSEYYFRFLDVLAEEHEILPPIQGYEKMPLVSLEEAIQPLLSILPDIRQKAHAAKLKCKHPADKLTPDQSAAIMLYTMEWKPRDQCLYFALNARLRASDRKLLEPWLLYLKLILTGLSRLPSIQRTVYRGTRLDLSSIHQENEQFFWWGFSSCTTTMDAVKSDQYLGSSGIRTLFHIECVNGKDIRNHSYYQKEDEILLLPATYFQVTSCFKMTPDLHAIQLKEIIPKFPCLAPV